jgi:hypothetical protein
MVTEVICRIDKIYGIALPRLKQLLVTLSACSLPIALKLTSQIMQGGHHIVTQVAAPPFKTTRKLSHIVCVYMNVTHYHILFMFLFQPRCQGEIAGSER